MAQSKEIINSLPLGTELHSKTYNYRIEEVLGQGSFGITYLAKVELNGNKRNHSFHVTIKEFFMKEINGREETTVTSDAKGGICDKYKSKFAQEAKNLQKLEHPNIVSIIDFFSENNTYYYAMDYLCGGNLDSLIEKESSVREEIAQRYIGQIGRALSYMHSNKMLHLDLKPANVMLNADDEAVVIDFGLSKQYDENGDPESSTTVGGGTPGYAPIEQSSYHDGHGFPVTMDIYALGATFYKLLVGSRVPDASIILNEGFPFELLKNHHVSQETIAVISKAMSPMKKDRYQSVKEFLADLTITCTNRANEDTVLDINKQKSKNTTRKENNTGNKAAKKRKTLSEIIIAGDDAYSRKDYPTALNHYLEAFRRDSSLGDIAFSIGEIYYYGRDKLGNENLEDYYKEKNSSIWFDRAYDLGIDTSKELLQKAKLSYTSKDYKHYLKILNECIIKNYKCKEAICLLIEAYEKGIGCKPEKVSWRLAGLRKKLQKIDNTFEHKTNISGGARNQECTTPTASERFSSGCLYGFLIWIIGILVIGINVLYNSRFADGIFDSNKYEEIGHTGRLKDDYITTYFKVYTPKEKQWGVVSVYHKKGQRPHPSTDNLVLPIKYDSIYADIKVDLNDNWNSSIIVYGYKNGELYDADGTIVKKGNK